MEDQHADVPGAQTADGNLAMLARRAPARFGAVRHSGGGRAGGGFVFDTDSLDRGMLEGNASCTVLVLEFHRHDKLRTLHCFPSFRSNPCPSVDGDAPTKEFGVLGYGLFPSEQGNQRGMVSRRS